LHLSQDVQSPAGAASIKIKNVATKLPLNDVDSDNEPVNQFARVSGPEQKGMTLEDDVESMLSEGNHINHSNSSMFKVRPAGLTQGQEL